MHPARALAVLKSCAPPIFRRPWLLVLTLALLLCGLLQVTWGQAPDEPRQALPTIFEFGRPFCPICQEMHDVLEEVGAKHPGQFRVRLVYISEEPHLFHQYHIYLVPSQVFLDASGQEVYRHEGPLTRKQLADKLRDLKFIHE
jgi:thiol-disulfide isomerase/thioredoxin